MKPDKATTSCRLNSDAGTLVASRAAVTCLGARGFLGFAFFLISASLVGIGIFKGLGDQGESLKSRARAQCARTPPIRLLRG